MNITLIGMSGAGKSRIGQLLAKKMNYRYIDVDRIIEKNNNRRLQELIDSLGDEKFLEIEEKAILSIGRIENSVISPGGSSIYSVAAMNYLKSNSKIVFLNASLEEIKSRNLDFSKRGIVGLKGKGLESLFEERLPLYKRYADVTIDLKNVSNWVIINEIIEKI